MNKRVKKADEKKLETRQVEQIAKNIKLSRQGICLDGVMSSVSSTPWQIAQDLYDAGCRFLDNDNYFDRKSFAQFLKLALEGCAEANIQATAKQILRIIARIHIKLAGKDVALSSFSWFADLCVKYDISVGDVTEFDAAEYFGLKDYDGAKDE